MAEHEIGGEYEKNTGTAILPACQGKNPVAVPGVLVVNHGPFAWGKDPTAAAHNAVVLESIARMAFFTVTINGQAAPIGNALHDRHFLRKHGRGAYYGQTKETK